ncbi:MAG: thioredoxin domain-containing protein [Dissulfurispiraceae bacterium]
MKDSQHGGRHIIMIMKGKIWMFPLAALVTLAVGQLCSGACSYLKGDFLGIDLNIIGVIYYTTLLILAIVNRALARLFLTVLVSLGVGAEAVFIGYQIQFETYCIKCLISGAFLIAMFVLTIGSLRKWATVSLVLVGSIVTLAFFSGSVTPTYALENAFPEFGNLKDPRFEIIVYSDYFCPGCRQIDSEINASLKEYKKEAKISFIDVPIHKETIPYAKVFLYAYFSVGNNLDKIIKIRELLFESSKANLDEEAVIQRLKDNGILLRKDEKRVEQTLKNFYSKMINKDKIKATPTVVIVKHNERMSYTGTKEIHEGLLTLSHR